MPDKPRVTNNALLASAVAGPSALPKTFEEGNRAIGRHPAIVRIIAELAILAVPVADRNALREDAQGTLFVS